MLRHQTNQLLQDLTGITKELSKDPVWDQIRSSKHSSVPSINSNEEHWKEPTRDSKIKTSRTNTPTNIPNATIIWESMITKVSGDKLSININMAVNIML